MIEQFSNGAVSTLLGNGGTITAVQTSFNVANGALYPQRGAFRLRVGTEIMVIGVVSGNTLSQIIRGAEFSTAAIHNDGDAAIQVISAAALRALSLPYRPSQISLPTVGMFTALNTLGVTITEDDAGFVVNASARGAGFNLIGHYQTTPTPPYSVIGGFAMNAPHKSLLGFGMFWRASGGQLATIDSIAVNNETHSLALRKANSPTSYNSSYLDLRTMGWLRWIKLRDDGTNRKCFISSDGSEWMEIHSVVRTDFLTPAQIGWHVYNENTGTPNFGAVLRLMNWDTVLG